MSKGRKFKLNLNEASKRAEESRSKKTYTKFWKVPEGHTAIFRVLPSNSEALDKQGLAGMLLHQYAININKKFEGFATCGYRTYPDVFEECAIMDAIKSIGDFAPDQEVRKLMPKKKGIFNVFVRKIRDDATGKEEEVNEVKVLEGPFGFYEWVRDSIVDPEIGVFVDPYDGIDVVMSRGTQDQRTSKGYYKFNLRTGKTATWGPVLEDEAALDEMLDNLPDLHKMFMLNDEQLMKQKELAAKIRTWGRNFVPEDEEVDDNEDFPVDDPFESFMNDIEESDEESSKEDDKESSDDDSSDDDDFDFESFEEPEEKKTTKKKTTRAKSS